MQKDIPNQQQNNLPKRRFENVATALYLVTNHLAESEPLKTNIREITHFILEEFMSMSDISGKVIADRLGHIRTLLRIASISGMMSEQNVSLLDAELVAIESLVIERYRTASSLSLNISNLLMMGLGIEQGVEHRIDTTQVNLQSHAHPSISHAPQHSPNKSSRTVSGNASGPAPVTRERPTYVAPHASSVAAQRPAASQNASQPAISQSQKNAPVDNVGRQIPAKTGFSDRQQLILKEIRNKGQLTIRDLAGKIPNCSDKTIQRELLSLVESGVLKKEGERRWSKYSIR